MGLMGLLSTHIQYFGFLLTPNKAMLSHFAALAKKVILIFFFWIFFINCFL